MAIIDSLVSEPPPLRMDSDGVLRLRGSRVTLDIVIGAHKLGHSPEQIHESYPSASLPDVYAAIAYYLRHREEVEKYLEEGVRQAEEIRREIEAQWPRDGLRERLLARQALPQPI